MDDHEMTEADPLEPNSDALQELQRTAQLVEQVIAEQEAVEIAAAERESRRQYTAELMAAHAVHEERQRLESQCGPSRKPQGAMPQPSDSPIHRRAPVPPPTAADTTSRKLFADV